MPGRKAAFHSLGCKVNSYETDAMRQSLLAAGYEEVPFVPGADVYVINTCTVTNVADRKSRQMLHKAKEMNPEAVVVAAGCYVHDAGERLTADPAVDIIVGNHEKGMLPVILEEYFNNQEQSKGIAVSDIGAVRDYDELMFVPEGEHTRAFVKIQDGCNQFCSYCMIPYVRGRVRSRKPEEILKEASELAARGYREIVLTGIHISSYGLDFDFPGMNRQTPDAKSAKTNERLAALIQDLAGISGIERIRLGSLEPGIITDQFVLMISAIRKVCPAFHLSLQSGCDETLIRMRRKYTAADFEEKVELLRKHYDNPGIMTDIIAGFPGETEEEFAKTESFVRKIRFSRTHVFKYSVRKGTAAERMPGHVPERVKQERSGTLIGIDAQERRRFAEVFLGKPVEALFEEKIVRDGAGYMRGYTREYVPVLMGTEEDLSNKILTVVPEQVTAEGEMLCEFHPLLISK
ncbi:MAG: tRNA (N(6)-L-threonylcarbamoyladenosine(37)-C(2))-methylthiotransferase MtaB [Lachnospiraceae bacterium]|nr:tRNA (N(6)-L-threonylcarbamoyladenosine(37)-C(2))-methylthiotransferase MtaB [Lachnospiraceae bacterium]